MSLCVSVFLVPFLRLFFLLVVRLLHFILVCLFLFYLLFSSSYCCYYYAYLYSTDTEKERYVDLGGQGGVGRRDTVIRIYCMKIKGQCLPLVLSTSLFWERVFHLEWLSSQLQGSAYLDHPLSQTHSQSWTYRHQHCDWLLCRYRGPNPIFSGLKTIDY